MSHGQSRALLRSGFHLCNLCKSRGQSRALLRSGCDRCNLCESRWQSRPLLRSGFYPCNLCHMGNPVLCCGLVATDVTCVTYYVSYLSWFYSNCSKKANLSCNKCLFITTVVYYTLASVFYVYVNLSSNGYDMICCSDMLRSGCHPCNLCESRGQSHALLRFGLPPTYSTCQTTPV